MRHHVVSIGISKHQDALANLQFASKDANEFFELFSLNLSNQGYKKLLLDSEATLAHIKTALGRDLREALSSEDAFFFFYSGHGATGIDPLDPSAALNYLIPFDATPDFENSCISINDLRNIFQALPSKANFIFIDSCFSGSMTSNSKSYPAPKSKAIQNVKGFANTVIGNGTLIFTACKDDQEAIEDPEYKNGLFTFEVFAELQKKRATDNYSAIEIFSPIADHVERRAKDRWHHDQTPTFSGQLEGNVLLPSFKKQIQISPTLLNVPSYAELSLSEFPVAHVELSDKEKEEIINETIQFVLKSKKDSELGEISFERYSSKLLRRLRSKWEEIFLQNGTRVQEVPNSVAKLEAESFQFIVLGAITATVGSSQQMKAYSEDTVNILTWSEDKAGLEALIYIPEIIVVEVVYLVGVLSMVSKKLEPLEILLKTDFDNLAGRDAPPEPLISHYHMYYCEAFGGYSDKVNDHVREVLKSLDWLVEIAPKVEGLTDDLQLQVNLLLSVWTVLTGGKAWYDFARFPRNKVIPFVKKVKYDDRFREQVCRMLNVEKSKIRWIFMDTMYEFQRRGMGTHGWWNSIDPDEFLTEEDKKIGRPSDLQ